MAGQPLKRRCHAALDKHEDEIFRKLAGGEYVTDICREYLREPYSDAGKGEPNNYHFYSWLDQKDGRRERFERVREAAADEVAEESVRLLDEAAEEGVSSTAEATLAKARSNSRQWWAAKLNRAKYGSGPPGVNVQVDISELHLQALKQAGSMELAPPRGQSPGEQMAAQQEREMIEADVEVVEESEG